MIWEQRSETPSRWKILPSGKIELIFRIGPSAQMLSAKKIGEHNSPLTNFCFLSGLHTGRLEIEYERFHHIGIQCKPIAVKALFDIPLSNIRDYWLEGTAILNILDHIEDKLCSDEPFITKARWLEQFIYAKIIETPDLYMAINLNRAICKITAPGPQCRNQSIEGLLGYSRTQSFRIFNEWFGLSVHSYQRLIQFVQSFHYLHRSSSNLTAAGLLHGYFDQAHFIRSFKEFAGMTPGVYRKLKTNLPGQLPF
jgi:AraC-like DNA-binding protein